MIDSAASPLAREEAFDRLVLEGLSGVLTLEQTAELDALTAHDPVLARRMQTTIEAWALVGAAGPDAANTNQLRAGLSRRILVGGGASGAVAASLGAWWLLEPATRLYQAPLTAPLRTILADGTQVVLSRDGRFRVQMSGAHRSVWMERGEALWTVAHDPARPFKVLVADHRLTVLGTRFNVDPDPAGLRVDLVEGALRVTHDGKGVSIVLKPGERYWASHQPLVAAADTAATIAWTDGRLVFDDASLRDVAVKIQQQTLRRFDLVGADTAALRFSGVLRADDPDSWKLGLEAVLPVRVAAAGDGFVVTAMARQQAKL